MKNLLKKILAAPFVLIAAVFVLLEDWLWDDLQRLAAAIGRLPIFRQFESFIVGLPPYGALAMFATPSLLLFPVKLAALWFIAHGQPVFGFLIAVAAKVAGTALIARIYQLTEAKLLLIGWFAGLHTRFVAFKARVYTTIKATRIYRHAHHQAVLIRDRFRRFKQARKSVWRRRWDAAVKFSRRPK
ncbi:MAG: hypothetical protein JNK38_17955 [Acidobacteria bacterium]|nr:hypothetical protein [Acidobacteriota bacterium]